MGMGMATMIGCAPKEEGTAADTPATGGGGAGAGGAGAAGGGALAEATPSELAQQYANSRFAFRSDWLGEPTTIAETDIAETLEADIVVVGVGHAGSALTRRAAELGAHVIAVEGQSEDAFSAFGSDIGHLNSAWQKAQGIPDVDPTDFMEVCQLLSANRIQPDLLHAYATRSGEMFDWLLEVMTTEQQAALRTCDWPVAQGYQYVKGAMRAYPGTAKMDMSNEVINTSILLRAQHKKAIEVGAQIWYGHMGEYLEKSEGGRVSAVIVSDVDGTCKRITAAKAVVLAAGDYAGNAEMFTTLVQEAAELNPGVALQGMGRDGSGVKMGLWAGGKMEPGTRAAMGANVFSPASPVSAASLWLNAKGERFCNEGYGHPFIAGVQGARQPFGPQYAVWDSNWREMLRNQMTGHGDPMFMDDAFMESVEPTLQQALDAGADGLEAGTLMASYKVYAAQSIEELAGYLGIDPNAFAASIERYNSMCQAGKDTDYAKTPELLFPVDTPPFYASVGIHEPGGRILVTLGGLFVDGSHRVIGDDFNPIDGLYAVGNNSGGRFPLHYSAPIHGMSLGMANTLGYVLGEEMAAL
jgi:succinate dehydrogenase/fumarate reductase flavoprotein subunit